MLCERLSRLVQLHGISVCSAFVHIIIGFVFSFSFFSLFECNFVDQHRWRFHSHWSGSVSLTHSFSRWFFGSHASVSVSVCVRCRCVSVAERRHTRLCGACVIHNGCTHTIAVTRTQTPYVKFGLAATAGSQQQKQPPHTHCSISESESKRAKERNSYMYTWIYVNTTFVIKWNRRKRRRRRSGRAETTNKSHTIKKNGKRHLATLCAALCANHLIVKN